MTRATSSDVDVERPSLRYVTRTIAVFALISAGLVIFIPSGIFLAVSQSAQRSDWLAWFFPLALWASAFAPRLRPVRAGIQVTAGLLLVLMAFVVPDGPAWIPVGIVTFAVIVAAIFNLGTAGAFTVIVLAAALDFLAMQSNPSSIGLFGVGLIAPWVGAFLNLVAGGGLLIAWTAWMRNVRAADAEFVEIQIAVAAEERARAARTGASAVARRIHETILNTLASISMGLPPQARERARTTCQRDLDQIHRSVDHLGSARLSDIVASAQEAIAPAALTCQVRIPTDITVEAGIANAMRDALVESLRNVERHSGVREAVIVIDLADDIIVTIRDTGRGPLPTAQERFGTRNAIRANLAAIGGRATLRAADGGGTEVTLHIPKAQQRTPRVPSFPILGIADSTPIGRLGATGTNIFMLGITPIIIGEFGSPTLTATTIGVYVACMFALALLWTTQMRSLFIWLGVVFLPLPFIAAGIDPLTCVAAPGVQGIVTGMASGGVLLLLIAAANIWARIVIILIALAGSVWLSLRLPNTCEQEALLSTGVTSIYMVAIVIVLTWIDYGFEARRTAAVQAWNHLLEERLERERQAAEEASWAAVPGSTTALLADIATGRVDVTDPITQARATREASVIRAQLGLAGTASNALDSLIASLASTARQCNVHIEAESLTRTNRTDPLPADLVAHLDGIIRATPNCTVAMRTIVDDGWEEIVVVLPGHALHERCVPQVADVITECEIDDDGVAHISMRRPLLPIQGT
jgi:signal transduction histidine kinase